METKEIIQTLWNKGIRHAKITWSAGGDDGSIENIEIFPNDRKLTKQTREELSEIAWSVYENEFGGETNGNFSCDGNLTIFIYKNGKYKAQAENTYSTSEYNEKTDDYENEVSETTEAKDLEL